QKRGHVERGREARLAVGEKVAEALVRLLGSPEAGELPHRPEPAPVHRRVHAPREREHAWIAEVAVVVDLDLVRRVERLVLEPRDRAEELPAALWRRLVELPPPVFRAA